MRGAHAARPGADRYTAGMRCAAKAGLPTGGSRAARWRRGVSLTGLAVVLLVASWLGLRVALGGTHVPVAIEPDAPRGEHVGVATFALG